MQYEKKFATAPMYCRPEPLSTPANTFWAENLKGLMHDLSQRQEGLGTQDDMWLYAIDLYGKCLLVGKFPLTEVP